ncbi:uncharacterized protein N7518_000602 [Penicillium psychrosexuale]|uniref:uncharacterized protein n=1 Tax=Penicillium psychrosexuale TaxID=1002107 RepID=UPI0025453A9E|nr:uncharacterized protein N7518_000602 [Penicillium psychrosexuale]KAJ5804299.1 hypothetical protein N7518_000602 [Penicillium psychrosexuale]
MSDDTPRPCWFVTELSCGELGNHEAFKDYLVYISQVKDNHEFVFLDVPPGWVESAFLLLNEVMSARCTSNRPSGAEMGASRQTKREWSTEKLARFPSGPYINSRMEPDFFFILHGCTFPTVAVECGWSETMQRLHDDLNLLLVGGAGSVKVVIIVQWSKLTGNRVSGVAELYMCNRYGIPICRQREVIFPHDHTKLNQRLFIKRGDLLGSRVDHPNGLLEFDIDRLREYATCALCRMDLTPAT